MDTLRQLLINDMKPAFGVTEPAAEFSTGSIPYGQKPSSTASNTFSKLPK